MLWDDFTRFGAPAVFGPAAYGVAFGRDRFPPPLHKALTQAGLHVEDAVDPQSLAALLSTRKHDFMISVDGPGIEALVESLSRSNAPGLCPAILVTEARTLPAGAPGGTHFAELLGSGQDALGYFLLLRATLRRKRPHVMTDVLTCGAMSLDQERFRLSLGGCETVLNLLEFRVLGAMLDAPRLVWNKVFLNRVVFGPVGVKPGRQFDTYMSRVRRGIRDRTGVDPIAAEHRMGYALSPEALGPAELLPKARGAT